MNELINIKQKNNRYKCAEFKSKKQFEDFDEKEYQKFIGKKNDDEIELTKKYNVIDNIGKYYKCELLKLSDFKILQNFKIYDISLKNENDKLLSSFFIALFNHIYLINPNLFTNEEVFIEQWNSSRELNFNRDYNNFDEEGNDTFQLGSKIKDITKILLNLNIEIIFYLLNNEGDKIIKSFSINKSKEKCYMIYYGGIYYLVYDKDNNSYFSHKKKEKKEKIERDYNKKLKIFLIKNFNTNKFHFTQDNKEKIENLIIDNKNKELLNELIDFNKKLLNKSNIFSLSDIYDNLIENIKKKNE